MLFVVGACVSYVVTHHPIHASPAAHVHRAIPVCTYTTSSEIEFPAPLSAPEKLRRAASFWVRILPVIGSYLTLYSGLQARERLLGTCLTEEACEVLWEDEHSKGVVPSPSP